MKILVIRFSSIGDIVLTSPVIRCLKTQLDDVELHFATKAQYTQVVRHNPYIDKTHYLRGSLAELITELRRERFDLVIDLHRNLRTSFIKMLLFTKRKSFYKLNKEKWLYVNFGMKLLPDVHVVDRYLETVRHLGVENDGKGLDYFYSHEDEDAVRPFLEEHEEDFIAFCLGGKFNTKKFPVEKSIELCRQIKKEIVLIGGEEELAEGEQIVHEAGDHVLNLCGRLGVNESAVMLKNADCVITNDTGMMHIAAALGKKIISLWGSTVPEFGMYPYFGVLNQDAQSASRMMQVEGLRCRPCSKLGFDNCPKGHFRCMNDIDIGEIVREVG